MADNAMLALLRASEHRPGGPWSEDDLDVVDGEGHVGRILFAAANYTGAPDRPWF